MRRLALDDLWRLAIPEQPRLAPDGRATAYVLRATDRAADRDVRTLWRVDDGGQAVPLTQGPADSCPAWSPDGQRVAFLRDRDGAAQVWLVDADGSGARALTELPAGAGAPAFSPDGARIAFAALTERRPEGDPVVAQRLDLHGWVLRDPDAPTPGPLLVDVHGGPHYAWTGAADREWPYHQLLAARGWTVLTVDPRGSDGYGHDFYRANAGRWGAVEVADVLEPVAALVREGLADPRRLAIAGYSYGSFLTATITTRDDRFAAAIVGGVVSDLAGMAGSSDVGQALALNEYGGQPWDVPDHYAAHTPVAHVARVTTPTLILHGTADVRCPVTQAQQWFAALRARGVPAELVLYPDGSHLFPFEGRPSNGSTS